MNGPYGPIPLVLDTNILIAAAYAPQSASHRIVQACLEGRYRLVVSDPLQREYERMVGQAVRSGQFDERLAALLNSSQRVQAAVHEHQVPADPDDDKVLATAVAGQAHAIVTNDQHLLVLNPYRGIRIERPSVFLASCQVNE
jgi:uncharacterized protein